MTARLQYGGVGGRSGIWRAVVTVLIDRRPTGKLDLADWAGTHPAKLVFRGPSVEARGQYAIWLLVGVTGQQRLIQDHSDAMHKNETF